MVMDITMLMYLVE